MPEFQGWGLIFKGIWLNSKQTQWKIIAKRMQNPFKINCISFQNASESIRNQGKIKPKCIQYAFKFLWKSIEHVLKSIQIHLKIKPKWIEFLSKSIQNASESIRNQWKSSQNAFIMHSNSFQNQLKMYRNVSKSIQNQLKMHRNPFKISGSWFQMHSTSSQIPLQSKLKCIQYAFKFLWKSNSPSFFYWVLLCFPRCFLMWSTCFLMDPPHSCMGCP